MKPLDAYARWPGSVAYVPQQTEIISGTIRSNIALGLQASEYSDSHYWEVIKDAQLYEVINSLPLGLETPIGHANSGLSGGQKQRLGLARALFTLPKLLILDEATSALDVETETLLNQTLSKRSQGITTITVAHRLSSIMNSDIIYYMEAGKILASGNFNELRRAIPNFDKQAGLLGIESEF
jgi:ABC-type multidrug transport system fused ATPase/permease subunit